MTGEINIKRLNFIKRCKFYEAELKDSQNTWLSFMQGISWQSALTNVS